MKATKFFALGGMQEIGKTCLVVEHEQEIAIIDAGIKFTNSIETGVDGIIPDYTYLKDNQNKIVGLFITHGHEDHIGGIPYLIQQVDIKKIYAPLFAIEIIKNKLQDKKINKKIIFENIERKSVFNFKNLKIDFWTAQHSIPDSFGIRIQTPNGSIMDTGDFRFDYTPIGNLTDFSQLEKWGKEGIDIFISDSTNAMNQDHSPTEKNILIDIEKFIKEAKGKVFFTTFASNLNRVKAVIDLAVKHKKRVCAFGRAMVKIIDIAKKQKFIDVAPETFVDKRDLHKLNDNEILILSTGSQGEELAVLSQVASGRQKWITAKKNDIIIFSSSRIPGNAMRIEQLVNQLYKLDADVKENKIDGILHTSGHAYKDEHKKIFQLIKPKYFVPYHGAYRQSAAHGETGIENGVKKENVFIIENGDMLELHNHNLTYQKQKIDHGPIHIDSGNATKQTSQIISHRERLGQNGFINIVVTIDKNRNEIIGRTKVISRGTLYVKESTDLMKKIQKIAHGSILYTIKNNTEWTKSDIKEIVARRIAPYFYKLKRRNPIVFTSVLFLNRKKQLTNLAAQSNKIAPPKNKKIKKVTKVEKGKEKPKSKTKNLKQNN